MAIKAKVRREKLKKLLMRGYHSQEDLAKALEVGRKTIQRDMLVVKEEIEKELGKEKFKDILNDFLMQLRGMYEEAWKIYAMAENTSEKIKALRLIHDMQINKMKTLYLLGVIKELPPAERKPVVIEFVEPSWWGGKDNKDLDGKTVTETEQRS